MNHVAKKQDGFTLIELVLAMAFISVLLLGIAMTIIQVGAIYNKGMTLKEVNQSSRDIADDFKRTVGTAQTVSLATDYVPVIVSGDTVGGRLCFGSYSYAWNYAKNLTPTIGNGAIRYQNNGATAIDESQTPIRFIKIADPGKEYCAKGGTGNLTLTTVRVVDQAKTVELLKSGDRELGIHQFEILNPVPSSAMDPATDQQLYSLKFTMGTSRINALDATQSACLPPSDPNSDPLYCNVQQFNLVVRVGSGVY